MTTLRLILAVLMTVLAVPSQALEWQNLGPRALGMGGAGVAMPQGPLSPFWNPAGLGLIDSADGFTAPLHVHAAVKGQVIEGARDLEHIAANPTAFTNADVTAALNKINQPDGGFRADLGLAPALKIKKVGIFVLGTTHVGAKPFADFTNATPATAVNNNSKLNIRGIQLTEIGAAYGQELPFAPGLHVGGALKLMRGDVGYYDLFVSRNDSESGDVIDKVKEGAKSSGNFGVDLGALWEIDSTFEDLPLRPRLGLTGRNLNNPKFSQAASAVAAGHTSKFAVNPQVRMGAAISPFDWWHFASDIDLTENRTALDARKSRQFSLGTEVDVFNREWINIPIRGGMMRNVAEDSKTMLSLGTGLNLVHVHFDMSIAWSPETIETRSAGESQTMPAEASIGVSLGVLFGGNTPKQRKERAKKAFPEPEDKAELPEAKKEEVRKNAEKAFDDLVEEEKKAEEAKPKTP